MGLSAKIFDALPRRLWRSGNLCMPFNRRPFSYLAEDSTSTELALHFCVGVGVRTVEWDGREIARGVKMNSLPEW